LAIGEELVETQLFPSILLKDTPILNDVNQFVVTLNVLQAENKNYLSLQRHHVFMVRNNASSS
jgi:hypothetical protein